MSGLDDYREQAELAAEVERLRAENAELRRKNRAAWFAEAEAMRPVVDAARAFEDKSTTTNAQLLCEAVRALDERNEQ